MNAPPHTLTFNLPTEEDIEGFSWNHVESKLIESLQAAEGHQKELRRTLFANSFKTGGRMMCSYEAIYSVARLLFSFIPDLGKEHWPLINSVVRNNPAIILEALNLQPVEFTQMDDFCFFILNGISTNVSPDIESVINATLQFKIHYEPPISEPNFNLS